jgi:hypothetical protein
MTGVVGKQGRYSTPSRFRISVIASTVLTGNLLENANMGLASCERV